MKKHRLTFREAINFVRDRRSVVCPNLGFEMQLKQYEKQLFAGNGRICKTLIPSKMMLEFPEDRIERQERGRFPNRRELKEKADRGEKFPQITSISKTSVRKKRADFIQQL